MSEKQKKLSTKKRIILAALIVAVLVVVFVPGNVVDYWWLKTYIAFRRVGYDIDNKKCETGHVVFLGDSITDGCDLQLYYEGLDAYNRGIAGDVTEGVLRRLDNIVALQPSLVVLLVGTNDYQRCATHSNQHILTNYRSILQGLHERLPQTKVLVQSVYPIADVQFHNHYRYGHGHIAQLNVSIAALAAEYGYTYADVYSRLVVGDEEMNMAYSEDGLHPNAKGYTVISAYLRGIIDEMLAEKA